MRLGLFVGRCCEVLTRAAGEHILSIARGRGGKTRWNETEKRREKREGKKRRG